MIDATRLLNLLDATEQEDVAQDADNDDSAGNQEVCRERACSVEDEAGYDRGGDTGDVVEEKREV